MSTLKKRGKRWYIRFTKMSDGDRSYKTVSLGTNWKSVAEDLQKKLDQLYDRREIDPFHSKFDVDEALNPGKKDLTPKTVEEAAKAFLKTKKKLAGRTYETYTQRLNHFIDFTGCKHDLVKYIDHEVVERFLFRDGISAVTANTDARHLNVFFNYLVKLGWLDKNPIPNIDIPEGDVKYYEKMLRDDEFKRLSETFDSHIKEAKSHQKQEWFKPMLATFYYGGFRLHEVAYSKELDYSGLQLKNIVDGGEMIWIPPTKGRKERFIPISKYLKPFLDDYLELRNPTSQEDYVFIHFKGFGANKPVSGQAFRDAFNFYCKKANIPKTRTTHGLRHHRITSWIQDGFGVKEASMMAGHSSTAVTEGVYTHLAFNSIKDKMRRIEGED